MFLSVFIFGLLRTFGMPILSAAHSTLMILCYFRSETFSIFPSGRVFADFSASPGMLA